MLVAQTEINLLLYFHRKKKQIFMTSVFLNVDCDSNICCFPSVAFLSFLKQFIQLASDVSLVLPLLINRHRLKMKSKQFNIKKSDRPFHFMTIGYSQHVHIFKLTFCSHRTGNSVLCL